MTKQNEQLEIYKKRIADYPVEFAFIDAQNKDLTWLEILDNRKE